MSRYILIAAALFLASVLTAQKPQTLKKSLIPDSVRFSSKVAPSPAKVPAVNIVCEKQGLIRKPSHSKPGMDLPLVYVKVHRKPEVPAFLTSVVPNKLPVRAFRLIPLRDNLVVPAWIIEQRLAEIEREKTEAEMHHESDDEHRPRIIKLWNLSGDFSKEVPVVFDTLFSLFNRYRIADLHTPVNAFPGNYGLPYYPISFFDRINDPDKFLYSGYYNFMHMNGNALFMNLQVPFTELRWTMGGEKEIAEQTFRITHSQNINRKLNFGMIYDIIFSLGQYTNQRSEDKTFTFYTSYTGSRYKLYFSAGVNGLTVQENGGITDRNELDIEITDTRNIPVNLGTLNDATSLLKNRNFLAVQKYTFLGAQPDNDTLPNLKPIAVPLMGTISHIFQLDHNRRTYSDASPGSGFYDSIYISKAVTFDSIYSRFVKNTLRIDFMTDTTRSVGIAAGIGVRNENFWFSQTIPRNDTMAADTAGWFRGNNVILGSFSSYWGKKYRMLATGELFIDRYRQGDIVVNGEFSRFFYLKKGRLGWHATAGFNTRTPSFWYTHWGSNHFRWNVDLEKESRLEFGTRISYPARKFYMGIKVATIGNYLDFDTLALPSQDTSAINVVAISLKKDFRLWKFHIVPDLVIQRSSNPEILSLPQLTVRTAAFIEHVFNFEKTNGRLFTQIGVDVIYHTLYQPYDYMPATGRFFRQSHSETGGYPFVNVFLNIKLKRTRFFLMFDHINYGMMKGDMLYNYDMIPLYPLNTRRFTFGLAWTFYN